MQLKRDAEEIKNRIMFFIQQNGPSIPIQVSKRIQMDGIFTAAFLSELLGEKKINMTNMRVGSSPVYYINGQEAQIEKFGEQHLKSKEKEAFFLLKEKRFLKDSEQEPAIRVAIRTIKDFAIPFTKNSESFWRYYLAEEKEFYIPIEEQKKQKEEEEKNKKPEETIVINESIEERKFLKFGGKKEEPVVEEKIEIKEEIIPTKEESPSEKTTKPKTARKKSSKTKSKQDEKFLETVKEFLSKKSVAILNIEGFSKDYLLLKIKVKGEEQLLVAYNKKKITEADIISAAKKASELELRYSILSLGELPKKVTDLIDSLKNLKEIERVE